MSVEICNMALDYLGTDTIESLTDKTDNAKLCKRWYDITRKSLLKDLNASFSIKRSILAKDPKEVLYGRTNVYTIPSDCLAVLDIETPMDDVAYQIEGNQILCDIDEQLKVRYIKNETDASLFDDEFKELLALKLAVNICVKATQDLERLNYLQQFYAQKYIQATTKYGRDNRIITINKSRYQSARNNLNTWNQRSFTGGLY